MNSLYDYLIYFLNSFPHWKYLIMALITILQGEVAVILFMHFVLKKQLISFQEMVLVVLLTIIFWENFVYLLGRNIRGTRLGWKFYKKIKEKRKIHIYFYHLKENLTKLILLSKFIPAVSFPFLFVIGWVKTKWRDFLKSYFLSLILWFLIVLVIAYSFNSGLFYLKENKIFKHIEILIALFIIILLFLEFIIKKIFFRKIDFENKMIKLSGIFKDFFEEKENK